MTNLSDLLYVALFAVALPLWDYVVFWPAFERQSQADPARARKRLAFLGSLWPAVALHALLDLGSGTLAWLALCEGSERGGAEAGVTRRAVEPRSGPLRS